MRSLPKPVDDPVMWKLVALVQAQLPNSARQGRLHLLELLDALEQEALRCGTDRAPFARSTLPSASSGAAIR